jgi:hypothetical protein
VREGKYNGIGGKIGKLGRGWVHWNKQIKNEGHDCDQGEKGIQWNRSQISVLTGQLHFVFLFCFTPAELYSGMENTAVTNCPNA